MKRNIMLFLCMIALVATCLASCNKDCDHTFSENWVGDANTHWHPATCEHGEYKDGLANHVDDDQDGMCDVCNYEIGHEHTYADEWITDEYHHWREAICAHSGEVGYYDFHSDGNVDCVCDLCGGHVHAMNIIGFCAGQDCGKQLKDPSDIANYELAYIVYATGINGYSKVNGGQITYNFTGRSNVSSEYEVNINKDVSYILGNGYTYTKTSTLSNNGGTIEKDTVEGWYEVDGDGVFGITKYDGATDYELVSASIDHLYGYYYALSTLADGHGAENILYSLFELSQTSSASNFEYTVDEENRKINFSFYYTLINTNTAEGISVTYYYSTVAFKYNEQYSLTSLEMVLDCYTADPGVAERDGFLEADVDFDYFEATGELVLRDNAKPDTYTVKVVQTVGERTATNPHPKSSFVPDSFDIFLDSKHQNAINGSVSANVGQFFEIHIGNFKPEGTSVEYVNDYLDLEVYDENGNLILSSRDGYNFDVFSCDSAAAYITYTGKNRYFVFYPKTAGVYTYSIYFLDEKVHEVKIYAGVENRDEVVAGKNQLVAEVTANYSIGTDKLTFTATTAGTYTFTFEDNLIFVNAAEYDASFDKNGNPIADSEFTVYYDFQNPPTENKLSFEVKLKANETISFYVTSDKVGKYLVSYSVK